jgi:hypothetical protein
MQTWKPAAIPATAFTGFAGDLPPGRLANAGLSLSHMREATRNLNSICGL